MSEMVDWSDLLPEIVCKIAGELHFYEDFANFVGVSCSWRSAVAEDKSFTLPPSRYPCLMMSESETEQEEEYHRQFLFLSSSFDGGMIHDVNLPEIRNRQQHHCLSTHGWLLTIDKNDPFLAKLIHPLSHSQIDLPRLYDYRGCDDDMSYLNMQLMRKVLISTSHPSSDSDFFVVVFWGKSMGIWRSGDVSWSYVNSIPGSWTSDMTYHSRRKQLYIAARSGTVFRCDVREFCESDGQSLLSCRRGECGFHPLPDLPQECDTRWMYLLEWDCDRLLIVTRKYYTWASYDRPDKTKGFQAYLFSFGDEKWSKIDSLGNRSVFLGFNSSFAVNATSNGDGFKGVKPNCIYFTDDSYLYNPWTFRDFPKEGAGGDMGVYHMSSGNIEPLFDQQEGFVSHLSPPLWLDTTS